ncbi:MAG: DEAD/DEAH box helicase [Gammaproteobacteria bacterium]|nr:DEAD/DEAH box helicase [Gammaproteobacteria bacterium]
MNFIKKLFADEDETGAILDLQQNFTDFDLPNELNRAIDDLAFTRCTPVQTATLPYSIDGRDIIAQAQTGTGKTAAFLISIITYHLENPELNERVAGTPFALIIAPTRELVLQITEDAVKLSRHTSMSIVSVVGGIDYEKQKQQLGKAVDIVVATPGRLLDFCRSGIVDLSQVESLVIDEADRMLNMGFIPDVRSIIRKTPRKERRQTQLFSATISSDIRRLAENWTLDPVTISIEPEQIAVDSVNQLVYLTTESEKFNVLFNLIHIQKIIRAIIFVNRRDQTRILEEKLYRHGFRTGLLTGEVPQKKRIRTLDQFKNGEIELLVATDVAGRGIHVDDISHVINYNLPEDPEDYVHRIGRTGRAGAMGTSISLVCESDAFMLPAIENLLGEKLLCEQPEGPYLARIPAPIRKKRTNDTVVKRYRSRRR